MDAGEWITAASHGARRLAGHLKGSSFLSVRAGDRCGVVLVMETGMTHRPSLALDLSPTDILHHWSLLTAEQRTAFIGQHPGSLVATAGCEHIVATLAAETTPPSMFDRFAGFFHGFAALERSV
jgi:hypothetical protein